MLLPSPLNLCKLSITADCSFQSHNVYDNVLLIGEQKFRFYKETFDYRNNTVTYFLYFTDMATQENFLDLLPRPNIAYRYYGSVCLTNETYPEQDMING